MGKTPLYKNQEIELFIQDISAEGQGLGKHDGYTVFVPQTLIGERVLIKVIKAGKSFGVGKLIKIIQESQYRQYPRCEKFGRCGGCDLMHLEYEAQLEFKRNRVLQALKRIGKQENVVVHNTLGMDYPYRYRNKGAFCIQKIDDEVRLGLFEKRTHRIVPIDDCIIEDEVCKNVISIVKEWAMETGVSCYNEETGKGLLRNIIVRSSTLNEVMVILCTNGKNIPKSEVLVGNLCNRVDCIKSIVQCINTKQTNVIMDGRINVLYGEDRINENILGVKVELSAKAFLQVNPIQTEALYAQVIDRAGITKDSFILDAYCGIGSIGLLAASKGAKVVGVECVEDAITDANRNAKLNNFDYIEFICGNAEEETPKLLKYGKKPDTVILDPPRKGCAQTLLNSIVDAKIDRVVYVSCNPETLARDVDFLANKGYSLGDIQPVDMFPHTVHVECVVMLSRVKE